MFGIDTSKWQCGNIDYGKAKNAGYDFVFLRIGYNMTKDPYFESDYDRAKKAGMKIGVYFYPITLTSNESIIEANRVLNWLCDKELDMPIAYDMEEKSMQLSNRKDLNAEQYNTFSEVIKSNGYVSMLYTGQSMFNSYFNKDMITDPLWIAKYGINDGINHGCPNVGKQVAIHQYTSAAIKDDFYTGKLDRNVMMISYEELMGKKSENNSSTTYTRIQFIKDIQSAIGAKVDGIAGKETLSKTVTVSKNINNRHAVVKSIQKYLNSQGYNCGTEDGIAGVKFDAAIKAYQKANGCVADGEITARKTTWKKLLGM